MGCKTQSLKQIDSAIVFYVVAKNNCGSVDRILGNCRSKNLSIEKMIIPDPKIVQSNLSNLIIFKFSVNACDEADLAKIKNKLYSVEGIINVYTSKNK